ncbi:MAG: translation initiation factor IF-2 [Desulfomonilaceae bacterium]|nr:translation initiation factor IF-2 [Desulfomonilaceae bacterium]
MALLTVDDLARDLKVKNEDLLRELATMGYEVEGPESHLETDDPVALRAQLVTALPQREVVEKRIKPTVIRRRMKKKPSAAREQPPSEPTPETMAEAETVAVDLEREQTVPVETSRPEKAESPRKPKKRVKKVEPARIIEMPAKPPATEAEAARERGKVTGPDENGRAAEGQTEPERETGARAVGGESRAAEPHAVEQESSEPARETEVPAGMKVSELPEAESGQAEQAAALGDEVTPETDQEDKLAEEKPAKKKKRKEKKMQPAQIIGRVELPPKKEPPKEPEKARPISQPPPPRPRQVVELQVPTPIIPESAEDEDKRKRKKKDKKAKDIVDEKVDDSKVKVRRRKEVVYGSDLYGERHPRGGRLRQKGKKPRQRKPALTIPKASKRRIKIPEVVSVANLSHKMSVKSAEVIQHLLALGVTASMNEGVDYETAGIVASEFGFEAEPTERAETEMLPSLIMDTEENLVARPPVITVMGHVDHGKTSILDAVRSTHVTDQEAGGITQHIGAYKLKLDKGEVVFLDTPGHEAFTAMRARGANVTDFVVLVVAADDGVMEQTREAINHARAANVPIMVAVNKIDKAEADRDRVLRELSEHDLIPEAWGGETLFTYVSAKTGEGMDEFLDTILLQAEMMELRANPAKKAVGTVVEARLDKGRGPVATVLVGEGTLRLGDPFVAGTHYGKVRAMLDHEGKGLEEAGPATPVEIQGFSGVPEAGELFIVVDEGRIAKQIGSHRLQKQREHEAATVSPASIDELLARMQERELLEYNVIIKADVQGSVEALKEALLGIGAHEVKVKVIHSGVGAITESDVMLASASDAHIIGFNVRPAPKTVQLAEQEDVDVRLYTVIYEAIEDVRKAMAGLLAPIEKETVTGRAEVRQTFSVARVGMIAGCYVTSGKIERSNQVRLLRDDVEVYKGRIVSMKRFKDDVKEALEGYECGIVLENYRDIKIGDVIEAFIIEQEKAELT